MQLKTQNRKIYLENVNNSNLIKSYFIDERSNEQCLFHPKKIDTYYYYNFHFCNYGQIDWVEFNPEKAIINHIQNTPQVFCNKNGLVETLRVYELQNEIKYFNQFFLKSYLINTLSNNLSQEERNFIKQTDTQSKWVLKSNDASQGQGVEILDNLEQLKGQLQRKPGTQVNQHQKNTHIVQKYLDNALQIEGSNLDLRSFVVILSTDPVLVLFNYGFIRIKHKTKPYEYWTFEQFKEHLQVSKDIDEDTVKVLEYKILQMVRYTIFSGIQNLRKQQNTFEIIGCDIIFNDSLDPYIEEFNLSPNMSINSETQEKILQNLIKNTLNLAIKMAEDGQNRKIRKIRENRYDFSFFCTLLDETNGLFVQQEIIQGVEDFKGYQEENIEQRLKQLEIEQQKQNERENYLQLKQQEQLQKSAITGNENDTFQQSQFQDTQQKSVMGDKHNKREQLFIEKMKQQKKMEREKKNQEMLLQIQKEQEEMKKNMEIAQAKIPRISIKPEIKEQQEPKKPKKDSINSKKLKKQQSKTIQDPKTTIKEEQEQENKKESENENEENINVQKDLENFLQKSENKEKSKDTKKKPTINNPKPKQKPKPKPKPQQKQEQEPEPKKEQQQEEEKEKGKGKEDQSEIPEYARNPFGYIKPKKKPVQLYNEPIFQNLNEKQIDQLKRKLKQQLIQKKGLMKKYFEKTSQNGKRKITVDEFRMAFKKSLLDTKFSRAEIDSILKYVCAYDVKTGNFYYERVFQEFKDQTQMFEKIQYKPFLKRELPVQGFYMLAKIAIQRQEKENKLNFTQTFQEQEKMLHCEKFEIFLKKMDKQVQKMFQEFADNQPKLNFSLFLQKLQQNNFQYSKEEAEHIFNQADKDQDGYLNEEFCAAIKSSYPYQAYLDSQNNSRRPETAPLGNEDQEFSEIFLKTQTQIGQKLENMEKISNFKDMNTIISKRILKQLATCIQVKNITVKKAYIDLDLDKDGKLSSKDIQNGLAQKFDIFENYKELRYFKSKACEKIPYKEIQIKYLMKHMNKGQKLEFIEFELFKTQIMSYSENKQQENQD